MTLFEKIYFTCLVLNIVFFILNQTGVFEEWYDIIDLEWLGYLLGFQIGMPKDTLYYIYRSMDEENKREFLEEALRSKK